MVDEPDDLVLKQLREFRREHMAGLESQARSWAHLSSFAKTLDRLATEFENFRAETRQSLREIQLSILASDNASLNRHNDLLHALVRIEEVEERVFPTQAGDDDDDSPSGRRALQKRPPAKARKPEKA